MTAADVALSPSSQFDHRAQLRYNGRSIGYRLASLTAGGPAPLIAMALMTAYTGRSKEHA